MAAYEAAMARRQLAPFSAVCFVGVCFFLLRLSHSICLVTHDACRPSSLGIDDTTFSPLRPSSRCIFSPPPSYDGQDASMPGLGGRDSQIRLDNAWEELLCSVGSVKNGQLTRP